MITPDPRYAAARGVLLDALEALADHRDAVIVAGAQAVYLRTGDADIGIAPYTTDADLAIDARRLGPTPPLPQAMVRRFEPRRVASGALEPGIWVRSVTVEDQDVDLPVDLIVPEGIAPPGGSRGARLGIHGKRAARKAAGLEAAAVDNDVMPIGALDPNDDRQPRAKVAGATALLIAKAHKIQDRLEGSSRPDRLTDKDASDVYRLMQVTRAAQVNEVADDLMQVEGVANPSRHGLRLLRQQFGTRRAPGVEMAVRSLALGVPERRIRALCTAFVASLDAW